MRSLLRIGVAALIGCGSIYLAVTNWSRFAPGQLNLPWNAQPTSAPSAGGETIRIASFNIQAFGHAKLDKPPVMEILVNVVRRFDVVAIQEVRSKQQDVLPRFIDLINAGGRKYDYILSKRLGRTNSQEQYAYIFDTERLEVDRRYAYVVADPGDRLHREPFVAAFRARGPPPDQAFTFTLANIHTDPDEVDKELNALDDAYRAVQNDGRGEDDVILLGDLNTHAGRLGELGRIPDLECAITEMPTNTRQNKQYDNLLFQREATSEFSGRCGVLNLVREFSLNLQQALEVSDHFPIWAEFSVYEGGRPGYLVGQAAGSPQATR